jgi:hypothetical protein
MAYGVASEEPLSQHSSKRTALMVDPSMGSLREEGRRAYPTLFAPEWLKSSVEKPFGKS